RAPRRHPQTAVRRGWIRGEHRFYSSALTTLGSPWGTSAELDGCIPPVGAWRLAGNLLEHSVKVRTAGKPAEAADGFDVEGRARQQLLGTLGAQALDVLLEGDALAFLEQTRK